MAPIYPRILRLGAQNTLDAKTQTWSTEPFFVWLLQMRIENWHVTDFLKNFYLLVQGYKCFDNARWQNIKLATRRDATLMFSSHTVASIPSVIINIISHSHWQSDTRWISHELNGRQLRLIVSPSHQKRCFRAPLISHLYLSSSSSDGRRYACMRACVREKWKSRARAPAWTILYM
jgi:hypothetical protein